jgi:hypothetical protein
MKAILSILFIGLFSSISFGQAAFGGGVSVLKAFGVKAPFVGAHILAEFPSDEYVSYYGKVSFYGKQSGKNFPIYADAISINTYPSLLEVDTKTTFNYTTIEGGRRLYFGNGYDFGFAAYGGTHLMAVFNSSKVAIGDYDKSLYRLQTGQEEKGSVFSLAFGLSGGVKNDFSWGTLYFEASFDYAILAFPSNQTAINGYDQFGSPLLFTFALGYKKNLFL